MKDDISNVLAAWESWTCCCGVEDGYDHNESCPFAYLEDADLEELGELIERVCASRFRELRKSWQPSQ